MSEQNSSLKANAQILWITGLILFFIALFNATFIHDNSTVSAGNIRSLAYSIIYAITGMTCFTSGTLFYAKSSGN